MEEACGKVWRSSSYLGDEDSEKRYILFRKKHNRLTDV
jgi:hypothetical protein